MTKISQYPSDTNPSGSYSVLADNSNPSTVRLLLSTLATFFWSLANIPTGATSPITRDNESQFAFVASGMVWTGDSYGVNRNASMTAGVCYINGRRISIGAVTARTFTASVDTYIDVLDNGDGTGTLVYTTATNNTASPALAANSLRIGIIVTGASTIAAAGSVNQGQENMILPIASSNPYAVTDSLGNLICPRDPAHRVIGYRQITTNFSPGTTLETVITGLVVPVIIPSNRKIKATLFSPAITGSTGVGILDIRNGTSTSGTQIAQANEGGVTGINTFTHAIALNSAFTGSQNFVGTIQSTVGNPTVGATSTGPAFILIELY